MYLYAVQCQMFRVTRLFHYKSVPVVTCPNIAHDAAGHDKAEGAQGRAEGQEGRHAPAEGEPGLHQEQVQEGVLSSSLSYTSAEDLHQTEDHLEGRR